jgi:hypothetical protein
MPQTKSDKCPKCGRTMVERFDERQMNGLTVYVPNGEYDCYWCSRDLVNQGK